MTYHPRLTPRAHQIEYSRRLTSRPSGYDDVFANLSEMGTGKTKMTLDEWGERSTELPDLLVVAPAGSYRNWFMDAGTPGTEGYRPSELRKHLDPALFDRMRIAAWVSGSGVLAQRNLEAFLSNTDRPRALFVNVEALAVVPKAQAAVDAFLAAGRAMMVVDESTRIRSPDSKRTDWVVRHGSKAVARRIMTGLPTPRAPTDLFSQFEFLDWRILGHRSYFTFRQRYAVMEQIRTGAWKKLKSGKMVPVTAWVDVAYRNQDELQARIAPFSYRVLKSECLDLPPKLYLPPRVVEMTDEQAKTYRELLSQATTELECGAAVSPQRRITQILRLHQILCGFVMTDDKVVRQVKSNRIAALMEVLEEARGKVIIWVAYGESVRGVGEAIEKAWSGSVAYFWGGNRDTRHLDEQRYREDPRCRFKVATPGAGGLGNTWVEGELSIYYSGTPDLEHRLQSEDRTHRDGQKGQATYLDLYVPGTVDERIMEINRDKIDMASALMGDGYRDWLRWRK